MAGRSAHVRRISATIDHDDRDHEPSLDALVLAQTQTRGRTGLGRMRTPERRRSSSQGDATPRPPPHSTLSHSHSPAPSSTAVDGSPSAHGAAEHGGTRRLGFLGEMLLSSAGSISVGGSSSAFHPQRSSPIPHAFLPHRSHSRSDQVTIAGRENTSSPTPTMAASAAQQQKGHTSPSKASSTRTYDSKLVSREMHRLGNLAHLPSLAPSLSATPSNISLAPPPGAPSAASILAGARSNAEDSPWTSLHVLVLPLFNEEPLRVPIEDLNQLVKRHIQTVVSAAPGKAVATLEHDTFELIAAGMVTLNAKLAGVEDEKLIPRVVELWSTFWTQVLPYLEGSLLPLQTDPILSSLYRLPKARPSSPTSTQNGKPASSSLNVLLQSTAPQIDVRALALVSFRDRVVLPLFPRLYARLTMSKDENPAGTEAYHPRLQQMLLVLVSQRSQRLVSLSLTAPPPQPTAGESAIARLLRAMHAPIVTLAPHYHHHSHHAHARAAVVGGGSRRAPPSFLSAGLPRDRRGRIAQKTDVGGGAGRAKDEVRSRSEGYAAWQGAEGEEDDEYDYDDGEDEDEYRRSVDTPRVAFADPGRERDKELLESLRSPDPESTTRMSMGGWGLSPGRPGEEDGRRQEDADDDDDVEGPLDWDSAQAVVERMVGMKSDALPPTPPAHQPQYQQQPSQSQPQSQPQSQSQAQSQSQPPPPPPHEMRRRMT